jgi:hypothetical protein
MKRQPEPPSKKAYQHSKEKVRIYVASASATSLLDQRRLVHLYPRIQHLPEMRNDGFINVASVWVDQCECHVERLCKCNVKSDQKTFGEIIRVLYVL